jgi:fructose-1,6-bisphosphatase
VDLGGKEGGGFSVGFDPLDGSSIIDSNFSVGSIFGIWPGMTASISLGRRWLEKRGPWHAASFQTRGLLSRDFHVSVNRKGPDRAHGA